MGLLRVLAMTVVALFPFAAFAAVQSTPELLLTWKANTYVPAVFSGVIFPTLGSTVDAAVTLIDGGKPISLAKQEVRWFLNNKLMKGDIGANVAQFTVGTFTSAGSLAIKVALNYRGKLLESTVIVPVAQPELVIRVPSPDETLSVGSHILKSLPYYWNIADSNALRVSWNANNNPATGEGDQTIINLDIPSALIGANLSLTASATNPENDLESNRTTRRLTILP